ncbi:class I SAM-dependent methyltransferase [Luteimonas sp. SDU82]|uniref:class I SAM-dependent methyltransferase n=1 Tax=Luteimonas sp. SDU82 TaxID=3422592 RepID=UPI003EB72A80
MSIPPSFDPAFYAVEAGLDFASTDDALAHFTDIGKRRGLKGSPGCNQGYFLRLIQQMRPGAVLEIGPGAAPRLVGANVYYFDVKTEDELRQRYGSERSIDEIPERIHFVDSEGDLGVIDRKFDVVFSSHVIEHSVDLVAHLNQVRSLLNDGGHYFLVIPNRMYTFDFYKPATVVEDVIAAHMHPAGSDYHFLRSYLLEVFRRTHNDPGQHWAGNHGEAKGFDGKAGGLTRAYEDVAGRPVARSGFHRWMFDEDSFVDVMGALYRIEFSPLRVRECYNTAAGSMSFNAILSL